MRKPSPTRDAYKRLKQAREAAGYATAAAFAAEHKITDSAYRHKENGTRAISVDDAKLYAHLLSLLGKPVSWQWIINGDVSTEEPTAEVLGYVGAGEEIRPFDDHHAWEPVPAPPGRENFRAALVRGKSMAPVYREGDVLFFGDQGDPGQVVGRDCMVQVSDGPRLIKRIAKGGKRGTFRLYSYASDSESPDVRLDWAAPVKWVQRK